MAVYPSGARNIIQAKAALKREVTLVSFKDKVIEVVVPSPATYEVVYGTAWSGNSSREGMAMINLDEIGRPGGHQP